MALKRASITKQLANPQITDWKSLAKFITRKNTDNLHLPYQLSIQHNTKSLYSTVAVLKPTTTFHFFLSCDLKRALLQNFIYMII